MEVIRLKIATNINMIIGVHRLSLVYHVIYMINELLVVFVYRGSTWPC
jgi:hypothetical protein